MEIYLKPIISACYVFPVLAVLFTLPYIIYEYHKYGSILVIRTGVVYTFIFYMLTSYFMTVLPLPPIDSVTPDSACMLLVPFDAVRRVVATVNITLSNPATYINLFKCGDFWQIAFNILLLVPFGVYLRYYFKRKQPPAQPRSPPFLQVCYISDRPLQRICMDKDIFHTSLTTA